MADGLSVSIEIALSGACAYVYPPLALVSRGEGRHASTPRPSIPVNLFRAGSEPGSARARVAPCRLRGETLPRPLQWSIPRALAGNRFEHFPQDPRGRFVRWTTLAHGPDLRIAASPATLIKKQFQFAIDKAYAKEMAVTDPIRGCPALIHTDIAVALILFEATEL